MIKPDILYCINCGMRKYVVSTGIPSMMKFVETTAHCCKEPSYLYDLKFNFTEDN